VDGIGGQREASSEPLDLATPDAARPRDRHAPNAYVPARIPASVNKLYVFSSPS
jgi:hypothetical protein